MLTVGSRRAATPAGVVDPPSHLRRWVLASADMTPRALAIGLLGPIEVRAGDRPVAISGLRERAVLADLALQAGRVVSVGRLIEDLWGDEPPPSARHAIEVTVSRIRAAIREAGANAEIVTAAPGYRLETTGVDLDLDRFERGAASGNAALDRGDLPGATEAFREALSVWRGTALVDLDRTPFAEPARQRLETARLAALERRIGADLGLGRHAHLVGELGELAASFPFHERFHEQLILALYRCGRQADALAAYRRARDRLTDELGIEPRSTLRELEGAILRQEGSLDLPAETAPIAERSRPRVAAAPQPPPAAGRESATRRRRAASIAVALALVGAVAAVPILSRRGLQPAAQATGVSALDPNGGGIEWSLPLPNPPERLAVGAGAVWATSSSADALYRIDPATRTAQTVEVGEGPDALAVGGGAVWVANLLAGTVTRVDASTSRPVQTIRIGSRPTGIAFGEGAVWVADQTGGTVTRLDPATGGVVSVLPLDAPPTGLAVGGGSLWVTSRGRNSVAQIDPSSGHLVRRLVVGGGPDVVVSGFGKVWVANGLDSTLSVVDPARGAVVATLPVGGEPSGMGVGAGGVWVANGDRRGVVRIDPRALTVGEPMPTGGRTAGVAIVGGHVWVGTGPVEAAAHRGGTLRIVYSTPPTTIDPANAYGRTQPWQLAPLYDTLVSFDHVGGADGLQLVPDLALAMPTVDDRGTTYTFVLRPGIRFSDGTALEPDDVRHGLERALALNPATPTFFANVVGAESCTRTPPRCDLSHGVTVDDRSRTVTFHLIRPDPEFLFKLTLPFTAPVPASIGFADVTEPVPTTGPYRFGRIDLPASLEIVRNEHFRSWSQAARPDGYVDRMVMRFGQEPEEEIAQVANGRADWTPDLAGDRVREAAARLPAQVHGHSWQVVDFAFLNTRVPPFDDVRVRRALNLALDRGRVIERLFGGSLVATPTCQVLPPTMPGYEPYCPYTVNASPDGVWLGPDLARARRLIAASGTAGMRVTYWSLPDLPWGAGIGGEVVNVLRRLGYRARMVVLPEDRWERVINDSRREAQIGTGSWLADYPSAANFFEFFLSCSAFTPGDPLTTSNSAEFCHPELDRLMARAERLQFSNPIAANALWARIDRRVTDFAPWVSVDTSRSIDFVSSRVGNFAFNPVLGILLDQLWVH